MTRFPEALRSKVVQRSLMRLPNERNLVSFGLAPMGPATTGYIRQSVEECSPSGLPGSNDLIAQRKELIETEFSGQVAASIGMNPKESEPTCCARGSSPVVIPPGRGDCRSSGPTNWLIFRTSQIFGRVPQIRGWPQPS